MVDIWTFVVVSIPVMILLGVRHAFDADHVTAIDNLVRLHNATKKSRWVGAGFSMGHMISVLAEMLFIIMIVGSVTAAENIAFWGGVIGITSLGAIGAINIYAMKKWGKTGSGILAGKVLVKPNEAEEKTASGIIIPDSAKEKPRQGKVILVGTAKKDEEMEVKKGDVVLYGKYAGQELTIDGEDYLLVSQTDILFIA